MEKLLSPKEAGIIVRMSALWVRQHAEELGGFRLGGSSYRAGRWRFSEEALVQYLKEHRRSLEAMPIQRVPYETATGKKPNRMVG